MISVRVRPRDPFSSGMGEETKKTAVCLCVVSLDMMRDDIMVDAAAVAAAR